MSNESSATAPALPALDDALRKITVSQNSAAALRNAFAPHFQKAHELAAQAAEIRADEPKKARAVRLALKGARTAAEHTRKEQKDDSLRFGKAVDGIYNVLEFQVVPLEKALLEIEEAEERAEAKRRQELQAARDGALRPYMDTAGMDLAGMPQPAFDLLLQGAKKAQAERIAAEEKAKADEAERQRIAEEQRKAKEEADRAERERMRAENERLAAEAAKERKAREESEAAAAAAAKKAKAEADAKAAAEKKRLDAERDEQQRIAMVERERREAAEAALAKIEKERKASEDAERAAAKKAKAAPDKEKLLAMSKQVRALAVPALASDAGPALAARIAEQVARFAAWLEAEAGKL